MRQEERMRQANLNELLLKALKTRDYKKDYWVEHRETVIVKYTERDDESYIKWLDQSSFAGYGSGPNFLITKSRPEIKTKYTLNLAQFLSEQGATNQLIPQDRLKNVSYSNCDFNLNNFAFNAQGRLLEDIKKDIILCLQNKNIGPKSPALGEILNRCLLPDLIEIYQSDDIPVESKDAMYRFNNQIDIVRMQQALRKAEEARQREEEAQRRLQESQQRKEAENKAREEKVQSYLVGVDQQGLTSNQQRFNRLIAMEKEFKEHYCVQHKETSVPRYSLFWDNNKKTELYHLKRWLHKGIKDFPLSSDKQENQPSPSKRARTN